MKIDKVLDPAFKKGETNGKSWVLMQVLVGDNVATIFAPAAEGDEVTLAYDEKYKTYSAKKLGTTKTAPKSFQADPIKLKQELTLEVARNQSIQRQVSLKAAVELVIASGIKPTALGGSLLIGVDRYFNHFMGLLSKQWVEPPKNVVVDVGDFAKINPNDFVTDDVDYTEPDWSQLDEKKAT